MKCTFYGLPIILDNNLNEKIAEALDEFVSYEDSAEIFIFRAEDSDFLKLCIKELAALKKRFPEKDIKVTNVIIKDRRVFENYWYEDNDTGGKDLIADIIIPAEDINGVKSNWDIWDWIISQCDVIFEYGYDTIEWRYKQRVQKIAEETETEILSLAFPETDFLVLLFKAWIRGSLFFFQKNASKYADPKDADKKYADDFEKIMKLSKYYGFLKQNYSSMFKWSVPPTQSQIADTTTKH